MSDTKEQPVRFQFGLKWLFLVTAGWSVLFSAVAVGIHIHPLPGIVLGAMVAWTAFVVASVRRKSDLLLLLGTVTFAVVVFCGWLLFHEPAPRECVHPVYCQNNLNQLGKALLAYQATSPDRRFPPAYTTDENGKPLHSWRTLILPLLARRDVYKRCNFDEPWDGPNNRKIFPYIDLFHCPCDVDDFSPKANYTSYVLITGPGAMWPDGKSLRVADAKDGAANTALAIEVANSGIRWAEPRDIDISELATLFDPKAGKGIAGNHSGGAYELFLDGSVRLVSDKITPEQLKALFTRADGEKVDLDDL